MKVQIVIRGSNSGRRNNAVDRDKRGSDPVHSLQVRRDIRQRTAATSTSVSTGTRHQHGHQHSMGTSMGGYRHDYHPVWTVACGPAWVNTSMGKHQHGWTPAWCQHGWTPARDQQGSTKAWGPYLAWPQPQLQQPSTTTGMVTMNVCLKFSDVVPLK